MSEVPPHHSRTNRGFAGSEFPCCVRRVRLRDTVVVQKSSIFVITRDGVSRTTPHLTRPRTPVPVSPPEARAERDCANDQEHHGAGDVGTAQVVLGGVSVGRWVLGGIVLRWDGG